MSYYTEFIVNSSVDFTNVKSVKNYLGTLFKPRGYNHVPIRIGDFIVKIFTNADWSNPPNVEYNNILKYTTVSVEIWENTKKYIKIRVNMDPRFKSFYQNIKKNNREDFSLEMWGTYYNIDIDMLSELLIYVYKLSKLSFYF
jgi:bifunctional pyridoxal-dependent enzyme with beta-cystathionase and maltose regulon repressor activities